MATITEIITLLSRLKNVQAVLTLSRISFTGYRLGNTLTHKGTIENLDYQEREYGRGPFKKVFFINNDEITFEEALWQLNHEYITCIKRCCCSMTEWFPSGIFTVGSFLLFGTAVRHEYILVHTQNYVILIEVSKNEANDVIMKISIIKARNMLDKKFAENQLTNDKWHNRVLESFENQNLAELKFSQLNLYLNYLIGLIRVMKSSDYNILTKNCKMIARSLLYFCEKEMQINVVIQSNLGIFTDKLGFIQHIDMVIIDKLAYYLARKMSQKVNEIVANMREIITGLRELKYMTYSF